VLLRLGEVSAAQKLIVEARACYQAVARLREGRGDTVGRDEIAMRLAGLDPADLDSRFAAARALVRLNRPEAAHTLRELAEDLTKAGREPEALTLLREVLIIDPADRVAPERLAGAALAEGNHEAARALLSRVAPLATPGLLSLSFEIELAAGRGAEARSIAERLVQLEPDEPAHRSRLARALALTGGTPLADEVNSAFALLDDAPAISEADAPDAGLEYDVLFSGLPDDSADAFLSQAEREPELDLTPQLDALAAGAVGPPALGPVGGAGGHETSLASGTVQRDLESVFRGLTHDVVRDGAGSASGALAVAETFIAAGLRTEARHLLEAAAHEAVCQFRACRMLARLERGDGKDREAVLWLERAVEAPAIEQADRFSALCELAMLLEAGGEDARALAVWLEAGTLAPADPDVETHVARLSRSDVNGGGPSTR
jgi:tetratricopeptide (TPR) repeat protein